MSRLDDVLALVRVDSVSGNESALAHHVAHVLGTSSRLEVEQIGDNVVARTTGQRATRLLVAGHLDTVPGDPDAARIDAETVHGVGACDMKGSLAVMLELAAHDTPRSVEVTWVFYAREEIARSESGLLEIAELRPDLLQADAAVLCEPTGGHVEAGCQGTLRVSITLRGVRAHTARPYAGRNAIHRLGELITRVASYQPRTTTLDGIDYVEQLQVVSVNGGVAANVVPDVATCVLNHRVAPDRTRDQATASLTAFIGDLIEEADSIDVTDWAPAAKPSLTNPHLIRLVDLTRTPARSKVGWTDVATLSEMGIPATNLGAGDPLLAHRSDEYVTLCEVDELARVLGEWIA